MALIKVDAEPGEVGFDASRLARIDRHFRLHIASGKLAHGAGHPDQRSRDHANEDEQNEQRAGERHRHRETEDQLGAATTQCQYGAGLPRTLLRLRHDSPCRKIAIGHDATRP